MSGIPITIKPLADSALLIEFGDGPVISAVRSATVTALAQRLLDLTLPGIIDIIPAYTTLLISFDLLVADPEAIERAVRHEAGTMAETAHQPHRRVTIPVCYGGAQGPDLAEVAALKGLTESRVIELHSRGDYMVACMGFSPGYGYLLGLPGALAIPRRSTPRVRVPAGSVAIGGEQTGVYPMPTPGGWWLLGQTPERLFDLRREQPFLLQPGDTVRFQPITAPVFAELSAEVQAGVMVAAIDLIGVDDDA